MPATRPVERLQDSLRQVTALIEKHRVLEAMTHAQAGPKRELLESLQHRQNVAELHQRLKALHPADLAYILESLPLDERLMVWEQTEPVQAGAVLVEVAAAVRESLVERTARERLLAVLAGLDGDDLAFLADALPDDVRREAYARLDERALSWVRSSAAYPEGSVGHIMTSDVLTVREDQSLGGVLDELRARPELPASLDPLFVVDARNVFGGRLPLRTLLARDASLRVADVAERESVSFLPEDAAAAAAQAFERYDLVAAPVVDERGKVLGRVTVDAVVDFIRAQSDLEALQRAGLSGEEDLFASAWDGARNRWLWLAVNLVTAFLASRVIGLFEGTIQRLVALAALMPIVASIGGNTGNQTVALMIRRLALDRLGPGALRHLFTKELSISLLNGSVWGGVMGLAAFVLYGHAALGLVMAAAVLLNLLVSAVVGIGAPLLLHRSGRDPAQGSSVLVTFTTDSMGFFIFLALARLFLG
jgi:magnesium transporter